MVHFVGKPCTGTAFVVEDARCEVRTGGVSHGSCAVNSSGNVDKFVVFASHKLIVSMSAFCSQSKELGI